MCISAERQLKRMQEAELKCASIGSLTVDESLTNTGEYNVCDRSMLRAHTHLSMPDWVCCVGDDG